MIDSELKKIRKVTWLDLMKIKLNLKFHESWRGFRDFHCKIIAISESNLTVKIQIQPNSSAFYKPEIYEINYTDLELISFGDVQAEIVNKIGISYYGPEECTCDSLDLFRYGCKCGYSGK